MRWRWRWRFGARHIVRTEGIYMRRWTIETPSGTLRLHHIRHPDDFDLHDHPWSFVSLLLRGSYVEQHLDHTIVQRRPGSLAFRGARVFHRICEVSEGGAWTLVLTGPVVRPWGFLVGDTWMDWRTHRQHRQVLGDAPGEVDPADPLQGLSPTDVRRVADDPSCGTAQAEGGAR